MTTPRLNRIITVEHPTIARDNFGSEIVTWKSFARVWAHKRPMTGNERFIQGSAREQALRRAVFRIRQRRDIFETYRVRDDRGRIWDIEGIGHDGRQWTDLTCAVDVS